MYIYMYKKKSIETSRNYQGVMSYSQIFCLFLKLLHISNKGYTPTCRQPQRSMALVT